MFSFNDETTAISSGQVIAPSSIVTSPSLKRRNVSPIWQYVVKTESEIICKVENCTKKWKTTTGNSSIATHLINLHALEIKESEDTQENCAEIYNQKAKIVRHSSTKQDYLTNLLLKFIVDDMHAFSIVNNQSFLNFVYGCDPRYVIPDRKTIKELISKKFECDYAKVKQLISTNNSKINLTTDIWVSAANEPYIAITAHFIDREFSLKNILLDFLHFPHPHDGINICYVILEAIKDYSISNKINSITSDNGPNMISGINFLKNELEDLSHIRCFAHVLNLGVKAGLENLQIKESIEKIRHFCKKAHCSSKMNEYLIKQASAFGEPTINVVLDVETRWNSTHDMLKTALRIKKSLTSLSNFLISQKESNVSFISEEDWKKTHLIAEFFEPFYQGTVDLSGENSIASTQLYSVYVSLIDHMENSLKRNELAFLKETIQDIEAKIKEFWPHIEKHAIICQILDPRFKTEFIEGKSNKKNAAKVLKTVYDAYKSKALIDGVSSIDLDSMNEMMTKQTQKQKTSLVERLIAKKTIEVHENSSEEVHDYLISSRIDFLKNFDILSWWKEKNKEYPILSKISRDFLSIMPTSVSSERAFSIGGLTVSKSRTSLHTESTRELMCLKSWLKI